MRTNPDDLAADLAELDQRLVQQQKRCHELSLELAIANEIYKNLDQLKTKLEGIADLRRAYSEMEKEAREHVQAMKELPF